MPAPLPKLSLHVDPDTATATVRIGTRSQTIVCQCLGERVFNGKRHVYLDRKIHQQRDYEGFTAFGAKSTVIVEN